MSTKSNIISHAVCWHWNCLLTATTTTAAAVAETMLKQIEPKKINMKSAPRNRMRRQIIIPTKRKLSRLQQIHLSSVARLHKITSIRAWCVNIKAALSWKRTISYRTLYLWVYFTWKNVCCGWFAHTNAGKCDVATQTCRMCAYIVYTIWSAWIKAYGLRFCTFCSCVVFNWVPVIRFSAPFDSELVFLALKIKGKKDNTNVNCEKLC